MKNEIKDEWRVGEGKYEGHRLILRQNVGARPAMGDARYSFRVGIAIPFQSPQKDGMPGEDELRLMERIEDLIYDYFDAKHMGVLCLVITTQGMREFITYSTTDDVADLIGSLLMHFPAYDIQHDVEQDKEWDAYKQWDL